MEARLTLRALILIATICPVTFGVASTAWLSGTKCIGGARSSEKREKCCENKYADATAMFGNNNSLRDGIRDATLNTSASPRRSNRRWPSISMHGKVPYTRAA
jgi:hypothetical protein